MDGVWLWYFYDCYHPKSNVNSSLSVFDILSTI